MPLTKVLRAKKQKIKRNTSGKFIFNKHNNNKSDFSTYFEESEESEYDLDEYLKSYIDDSTTTYYRKYGSCGKFTIVTKETNSLTNFFKPINLANNNNEINNETVSFVRIDSDV
ncbi:hypothetical protein Glove_334g72 [Diversispora epigaea]|uniref:Uncharacterized protein n=1 Tax=Diversispora epigaea TaxID=1348612 RepID=A0A397HNU4_9GLOM|nr:hypothetical protein Glove_334g72 [Diversispora epigaea]